MLLIFGMYQYSLMLGGIDNRVIQGEGKTVTINATCIFSGMDIK